MKNSRELILFAIAAISLGSAACAKKKVAAAPPPAPQSVAEASKPTPNQQPVRAAVTAAPVSAGAPESRFPGADTQARIDELLGRIEDAYFDYNRDSLRPDAVQALQADSTELRDILKDYPGYKLTIEGHADERGSAEYNMALGDSRAHAAKNFLVQVGIPNDQLNVVSYGKEKPACQEHDEKCWQKNRRIHIGVASTL